MFLRVLVCDGPALLGWVGAMRSEPFEARELRLMRELIPSLQRRLALDARLREAGMMHAALEAALESLGQAAYVVTSTGRVAYANSAGRVRLEQDARTADGRPAQAPAGRAPGPGALLHPACASMALPRITWPSSRANPCSPSPACMR